MSEEIALAATDAPLLAQQAERIAALERETAAARAVTAYANDYRARTGRCFFCGFGRKLNGDEFHGTGCVINAYNQVVAKGAL